MSFVIVIQFEIIVGTYTRDLQKYVDFFSLECNILHTAITNTLLKTPPHLLSIRTEIMINI